MSKFYRLKSKQWYRGVLAGIANRYQWDLSLVRGLFMAFVLFTPLRYLLLALYFIFGWTWSYKDEQENVGYFQQGPRKRKDAEIL